MGAMGCLVAGLAIVGLVGATPARAQLSGASVSTTGSSCPNGNNGDGYCGFSAGVVTNTATTFATRYAWNINADVGAFTTRDTTGTASHNLSFTATAVGGYLLTISTSRVGDINRISDLLNCEGSADTGPVAGSSNITLSSGSLGLADPGSLGNGTSTASVPFSQSGSATICRASNGVGQAHSLTFTWTGSVRSNSCEAAVRQGQQNGTTSGCSACGYAGSPSRTQSSDGHFVTVSFASLCGNGITDGCAGEGCDDGVNNGTAGSCCTSTCQLKTAGTLCRAASGVCDNAEVCNGVDGGCPIDSVASAFVTCRSAAGDCDLAENCDGVGKNCPTDTFKANTVVCRPSGGVCDVADNCTGTGPTCPADAKSTAVCRPAAGVCDVADSCDGVNNACPADGFQPSGTVCRPSAGVCDLTDLCTGTGPGCPADAKSTFTCRPAAGVCDVPEDCDGVGNDCPADSVAGAFVVCRPASDVCDVTENCDGAGVNCPADGFQSASTVCRPSAGVCDPAENCTGSGAACPADAKSTAVCRPSAGVCDPAESCDGVNNACPAETYEPASTVCRPSAGVCDVAENCTGSGPLCPADGVQPASAVCRPSAGVCDPQENCDGSGVACPPDSLSGAFVECRPSAGECDPAENCTGGSATCPSDDRSPNNTPCTDDGSVCTLDKCDGTNVLCQHIASFAGTVCRPAAGPCDVDEECDGSNPLCPADVVATASVVCRPDAGQCDVADLCDGVNTACPADQLEPNGTPCVDGNACTADTCQGGACVGVVDLDACLDEFLCYKGPNTKGSLKLPTLTGASALTLEDQFENTSFDAKAMKSFCTPVSDGGVPIVDPDTHLRGRPLKANLSTTPFVFLKRLGLQISNQWGTETIDVVKREQLLTPANKTLVPPPPGAPVPGTHEVDHFKCYKIKRIGRPVPFDVTLEDQFRSPAGTFTVVKAKRLCTPVNKNGEGILHPDRHLVCYKVKPAVGTTLFVRRNGVQVATQFGTESVDVVKELELCVPSEKSL